MSQPEAGPSKSVCHLLFKDSELPSSLFRRSDASPLTSIVSAPTGRSTTARRDHFVVRLSRALSGRKRVQEGQSDPRLDIRSLGQQQSGPGGRWRVWPRFRRARRADILVICCVLAPLAKASPQPTIASRQGQAKGRLVIRVISIRETTAFRNSICHASRPARPATTINTDCDATDPRLADGRR